jgi:hypothetical protein
MWVFFFRHGSGGRGRTDARICVDDGSMSKDKREASLEKIRNSKSTRVILISFKAGSTGKLYSYRRICFYQ